jgi:hypothetical protein
MSIQLKTLAVVAKPESIIAVHDQLNLKRIPHTFHILS